jgi:peptidyl-prolyl isomerase H (cyclophilin H)
MKRGREEEEPEGCEAQPPAPVTVTDLFKGRLSDKNPIVFMDLAVSTSHRLSTSTVVTPSPNDRKLGRLYAELYSHSTPKTAENFRQLCTGELIFKELPTGYKQVPFHRIMGKTAAFGGDVVHGRGTGSLSIYGTFFDDENYAVSHDQEGTLSMFHSAKDRNGCQFFITAKPQTDLDGKSVAFGRLLLNHSDTRKAFDSLMGLGTATGEPKQSGGIVYVAECGEM